MAKVCTPRGEWRMPAAFNSNQPVHDRQRFAGPGGSPVARDAAFEGVTAKDDDVSQWGNVPY